MGRPRQTKDRVPESHQPPEASRSAQEDMKLLESAAVILLRETSKEDQLCREAAMAALHIQGSLYILGLTYKRLGKLASEIRARAANAEKDSGFVPAYSDRIRAAFSVVTQISSELIERGFDHRMVSQIDEICRKLDEDDARGGQR